MARRLIPQAAIQQRTLTHPWQLDAQVEQDLLLEAVLHRAAKAGGLDQFVFIGGTCLHKLNGPGPLRYSEDLDFVWTGDGTPDDALRAIADHSRSLDFERVEVVTSTEVRFPKVLFFYENHDGLPAKMNRGQRELGDCTTRKGSHQTGGAVPGPWLGPRISSVL